MVFPVLLKHLRMVQFWRSQNYFVVFLLSIPRRFLCCRFFFFFFFFSSVVPFVGFVLSLFVPHSSSFWCLGWAVLFDCGISWIISNIFYQTAQMPTLICVFICCTCLKVSFLRLHHENIPIKF